MGVGPRDYRPGRLHVSRPGSRRASVRIEALLTSSLLEKRYLQDSTVQGETACFLEPFGDEPGLLLEWIDTQNSDNLMGNGAR